MRQLSICRVCACCFRNGGVAGAGKMVLHFNIQKVQSLLLAHLMNALVGLSLERQFCIRNYGYADNLRG
jgi:hypothetical protein